jgi:SAM-dependent methyltransferase
LEIGVRNGENYFAIDAHRKFGVDPNYFFAKRALMKSWLRRNNWTQKMFRCTSDYFFLKYASRICLKQKFDLIFVDGMHTYEQSLMDAINGLRFLKPDGWLVFHDCNPWCEESAQPNIPSGKVSWNGDVWKTIYHLRQYQEIFECFTYDADEGLGVLKLKSNAVDLNLLDISTQLSIKNMIYDDLQKNRDEYLGLRKLEL